MSIEFQQALTTAIQNEPDTNPFYADRIARVFNAPDSIRKRLVCRMLEHRALIHLHDNGIEADLLPDGTVNPSWWSTINWAAVLTTLLKVLVASLPLLIAL